MTEAFREVLPEADAFPAEDAKARDAARDVLIRPAEERDVPAIAALEKCCFPDAWSENSVMGTLNSPIGYVLIAEAPDGEGEKRPRGYLIAQILDDEGELLRIAAAPEERRRGTGRLLLERMLADHPEARIWRLDVRTKNAAAIALYEKYGFRIAAENRDVYREPKDNGYLMIRKS